MGICIKQTKIEEKYVTYELNKNHKKLVQKALNILNCLNAPISKKVVFKYCKGYSRFGYCIMKNGVHYVYLNKDIGSEDKFVNTAIHELLHTIDNTGFTAHKGNWLKWAKLVSENTQHKIEISDKGSFINYLKSPTNIKTIVCVCPLCGKTQKVEYSKIKDGESKYYCSKCLKPLFVEKPKSILKDLDEKERTINIQNACKNHLLSIEDVSNYIIYSNRQDTQILVEYCLNNYDIAKSLNILYKYIRVDKFLLNKLANDYCLGAYDNTIKTTAQRLDFEKTFASTKYWVDITKHSNEIFGYLGRDKYPN